MRRLRTLILLFVAAAPPLLLSGAPPPGEIRLIMQGDDMGAGHGINVATLRAYTDGVLRSANVLMPAPWAPEAASLLRAHPELDAGVHLTLTSEWTNVKWRPLTHAPSLVDADGYFFPMVWPNDRFPARSSLKEAAPTLAEIERELRAQIELAKRRIPQLTYAWNHMGFDSLSPEVKSLVQHLVKEFGLVSPTDLGVQFVGNVYDGGDSGATKADKLAAKLEALQSGTWLMVDHLATDDPEMRAFGHPGYENVAADRSAVLEAWTSPKVKAVVARRGIKLTNYRELIGTGRER
jgi:chitin disaccharide deacetylase